MSVMTALRTESVQIPVGTVTLTSDLTRPTEAQALIIFAHGSGSSRLSPRNRAVASALCDAGFATLLLDLLTVTEERTDIVSAGYRFDIELLANRLVGAIDWAGASHDTRGLPIGLFGASTGAAAALVAAAERPDSVAAVVSRGGRPDLAWKALGKVRAPTLLIVGGADTPVIQLNLAAARQLRCIHRVEVVPGASHLFEEAGALDQVTAFAASWFQQHLTHVRAS